jgi:polar amino acid transport system permease protein
VAADEAFNFTPYLVAGLLFVLLAIPTIRLADWVTLRAVRRQQASGSL